MREIKFRGKRKDNGEWVYGYYVFTYNCCYIINNEYIEIPEDNPANDFIQVFPESIGQYIGKKDKNGKEIYEGDIIKTKGGTIGDVQFSHGTFGIEWVHNKKDKGMVGSWGQLHNLRTMDCSHMNHDAEMEVIGNIHETPELLK